MGGPRISPTVAPTVIRQRGVTRISSLVLPATTFPKYTAAIAARNAPRGSPGPERVIFPSTSIVPAIICDANPPIIPETAADKTVRGFAFNLIATPHPMPAPVSI